jgi:hypothetical protein
LNQLAMMVICRNSACESIQYRHRLVTDTDSRDHFVMAALERQRRLHGGAKGREGMVQGFRDPALNCRSRLASLSAEA